MSAHQCPVCRSDGFEVFLEIEAAPVHVGVVWPDRRSAVECPRGDIDLAFCRRCGFVYNVAFDEARVDYTLTYDNALGFSPTFQAYERALCERLIDRYDVRDEDVLELGAGTGRFLGLLCELGRNRGVGFDPSHDPSHADALLGSRARILPSYFDESEADRPIDLLCCRHVLEHLEDPIGFLTMVRRSLAGRNPEAVVYFEVPNAHLALRERSIWDVIYEHTGYFVPSSLETAFLRTGFQVLDVHDCFDAQFVGLEARIDPDWREDARFETRLDERLPSLVAGYAEEFDRTRNAWRMRLEELHEKGRDVVVWGGGAKAVSFFSLIPETRHIRRVVDINPGKQGSFLAGGGQEIVSPERLPTDEPDVVVVMNPIYMDEIASQLSDMGLQPEIMDVHGRRPGEAR